jgi:hypothetical protein
MSEAALDLGLVVETFDHRFLGVISGIDEGRILLRPHFGRPFWLTTGLVRSVEGERVRLHIDKRVLSRYRQPATSDGEYAGLRPPTSVACSFLLTLVAAALWIAL